MQDIRQHDNDIWMISNALSKYAWGYDEGDFELLADAFTTDATVVGKVRNSDQGWGPTVGRDEIVAVLKEIRLTQSDQRRHNITNILVESLTGDTAQVRCNLMVCATEDDGPPRIVATGLYRCELVKQEDTWRIKRQDAALDSGF